MMAMDLNQAYEGPFSPEPEFLLGTEDGEDMQNRCPRMLQILQVYVEEFWRARDMEMHQTPADQLKLNQLPLARVKRIMKGLGGAQMVSAEAPVVMSKACEMFILELTMRAWLFAEDGNHRTLQASDVVKAIRHDDAFEFLSAIANHFDQDNPAPMGSEAATSMGSTVEEGSSVSQNQAESMGSNEMQ